MTHLGNIKSFLKLVYYSQTFSHDTIHKQYLKIGIKIQIFNFTYLLVYSFIYEKYWQLVWIKKIEMLILECFLIPGFWEKVWMYKEMHWVLASL